MRGLPRRSLLSGLASAGVLAPFLPPLAARARAAGAPRRVIFFFTPNGHVLPGWGASGTETDFTLGRSLEPLAPHRKDLLVLDGIGMRSYEVQSPRPPNDHGPVLGHVLTAHDVIDPQDGSAPTRSSTWFAGHPSIDQVIAARVGAATRFPSLVLGVKASGHLARLSYRGPRDPVPPQSDPRRVFDQVFQGVTGDAAGAERLRAQQRSVLDVVGAELAALRGRLPADDRQKIDAHLERLRTLERRLAAAGPVAGCAAPVLKDDPATPSFVVQGRQQMDLIALALACDLCRVVNLQWSVGATSMSFPWIGENGQHHALAHSASSTETRERLAAISRWYAGELRGLIARLAQVPEGGGSVFDNTVIVWYSEHGNPAAGHPRNNVPFLLAGRCGGYFRTGRSLRFASRPAHNDLFVSIAHAMGLTDVRTFGNPRVSTGPLPGLT